ncbi:MAG: tRNA-intron lyase [Aigarchaeota archaeon]|nr:tRNA-intron lyase [Aigarchaeota archaeon]MDW7986086.1 tRNA-intron lyase [Nitrososphaerota archaeon]
MMKNERPKSEEKMLEATYVEREIIAKLDEVAEQYLRKGYGSEDQDRKIVKYSPVEALHLLELKRMNLKDDEGKDVNFNQLLAKTSMIEKNLWRDYIVYRDLRRRNYVVKDGFSSELRFRVFERGEYSEKPAKYLVAIIYEGKNVSVEKIMEWLEICRSVRKELTLAVVDRRNEVVYYTLKTVDLVP